MIEQQTDEGHEGGMGCPAFEQPLVLKDHLNLLEGCEVVEGQIARLELACGCLGSLHRTVCRLRGLHCISASLFHCCSDVDGSCMVGSLLARPCWYHNSGTLFELI